MIAATVPCGPQAESKKAVLVQGRVAVSMAGVHTVLGNPHQVAPYSFPSFIGQVEARLTRRATVSEVSEAVKEEAGKVFLWFDLYLRRRLFGQKDFAGKYPVEYLIAGYEAGDPKIYAVRVEIDWQQLRLKDVQRLLVHPPPDDRAPHGIYGAGSTRVLHELTNQQGALFRRVMSRAPFEGQALLDTKGLLLEQAGDLALTLLEIEATANPEHRWSTLYRRYHPERWPTPFGRDPERVRRPVPHSSLNWPIRTLVTAIVGAPAGAPSTADSARRPLTAIHHGGAMA